MHGSAEARGILCGLCLTRRMARSACGKILALLKQSKSWKAFQPSTRPELCKLSSSDVLGQQRATSSRWGCCLFHHRASTRLLTDQSLKLRREARIMKRDWLRMFAMSGALCPAQAPAMPCETWQHWTCEGQAWVVPVCLVSSRGSRPS